MSTTVVSPVIIVDTSSTNPEVVAQSPGVGVAVGTVVT